MDNAGYVGLSRHAGLIRKMTILANNVANVSTTGYRRESTIFAEHVKRLGDGDASLSIASMTHRYFDFSEGALNNTGNTLDVAISGEGFFRIETPRGDRITRAGAFSVNAQNELVTREGHRVLDDAGGPIALPPSFTSLSISPDGSMVADGQQVARLGVFRTDSNLLTREGDALFRAEGAIEVVETPQLRQGAVEGSNVSAVAEIAELIEVQRAYEMGQQFMQNEDERIRRTVRELGQSR